MTKERINISSQTPWEPLRGYSRAVVIGDRLLISGTTALGPNGQVQGLNDPYAQTRYIIEIAKSVVAAAGFQFQDIVRTRLFVTDIKHWQSYAAAHSEAFDKIRPASAIVEVSALVDPRLLVEIEFEAERGATSVKFSSI